MITWIFPIREVKSAKPANTMIMVKITSIDWLVGVKLLPIVLQT